MKDEVIVRLEREEALAVLRSAADAVGHTPGRNCRNTLVVSDKEAEAARFRRMVRKLCGRLHREPI